MAAPSLSTRIAKTLTPAKSDWLAERRGYLGATDIAAILGIHPYKSPHDVWLEKRGLADTEENTAMRAGTYMEAFIAKEWQIRTGRAFRRSQTYRHPEHPFLACNPDREFSLDGVPALLECKNVGFFASQNFGADGADQVPEHYLVQIHWQLLVTGRAVAVLAALIDNREVREYTYTTDPKLFNLAHVFDPETGEAMVKFAVKWWQRHMVEGFEPPVTGHESDTTWLKKERATYENGLRGIAPEEIAQECKALELATKAAKEAELVEEGHRNRIKAYMAEFGFSELECPGYSAPFTWKTVTSHHKAQEARTSTKQVFNTPFRSQKA